MNGYIQLPRWLYSHPVMKNAVATQCFLLLLYQARFQQGEVFFRGSRVFLEIGECVISRRDLASRLETTPQKAKEALDRLAEHGLILCNCKKSYTIIKIVGFEYYQPAITQPQNNHRTTTESLENTGVSEDLQPQNNHRTTTEKKKEKNNINNILYSREFELFWERYPKKFNKQQTYRNYVKAAKAHGPEAIKKALDVYLAEIEAKGTAADYLIRSTNFVGQKAYFLGYLEQVEEENIAADETLEDEAEKTRRRLMQMREEDGAYGRKAVTV